jgi:hypothetical protein
LGRNLFNGIADILFSNETDGPNNKFLVWDVINVDSISQPVSYQFGCINLLKWLTASSVVISESGEHKISMDTNPA